MITRLGSRSEGGYTQLRSLVDVRRELSAAYTNPLVVTIQILDRQADFRVSTDGEGVFLQSVDIPGHAYRLFEHQGSLYFVEL